MNNAEIVNCITGAGVISFFIIIIIVWYFNRRNMQDSPPSVTRGSLGSKDEKVREHSNNNSIYITGANTTIIYL